MLLWAVKQCGERTGRELGLSACNWLSLLDDLQECLKLELVPRCSKRAHGEDPKRLWTGAIQNACGRWSSRAVAPPNLFGDRSLEERGRAVHMLELRGTVTYCSFIRIPSS